MYWECLEATASETDPTGELKIIAKDGIGVRLSKQYTKRQDWKLRGACRKHSLGNMVVQGKKKQITSVSGVISCLSTQTEL